MAKYLDGTGLQQVWTKAKNTFSPLSHSHKYISATSITTDSNIVQEDLRVYYGSGGDLTGSVSSMAYAAILTIGYPNRGWQAWAQRGDGDGGGMYWRRGLQDSSDWNTPRLFLDSSNYTGYTVTKTGTGASGTWSINVTGSAGSVDWGNVLSKPNTATRWPSWSEVTDKPSTFSPSSHTHNIIYERSDARSQNPTPRDAALVCGRGYYMDFVNTGGPSDQGTYSAGFFINPWNSSGDDWSGGGIHELRFNQNGKIYHRIGNGSGWRSWETLITTSFALTNSEIDNIMS